MQRSDKSGNEGVVVLVGHVELVKRFAWMCWKVNEMFLGIRRVWDFFSVHVCFMCFFLVDLSAKTTKPEVDISTCKDTQGRGRRVVQLAEAARETQIMDFL